MFLRIPFNVLNGIIEEKKRDFLLSFLPQKIKFKRKKMIFYLVYLKKQEITKRCFKKYADNIIFRTMLKQF